MPQNIEIKARMRLPGRQRAIARELSGSNPEIIDQADHFYHGRNGRLKLRDFGAGQGELIHYLRPDQSEPGLCHYSISRVPDIGAMHRVLKDALGLRGTVCKRRELYLVAQTRIHMDTVEGLGEFIELEVVLDDSATAEEGERIARQLMCSLEIKPGDLIEDAYIDLLEQR